MSKRKFKKKHFFEIDLFYLIIIDIVYLKIILLTKKYLDF
jgi:hypothetical protein